MELTGDGEAMFARLVGAVVAFDEQLRAGLTPAEVDTLHGLLERLTANVTPDEEGTPR